MLREPKFKVDDKVRILPSAVDIGVYHGEFGKIGMITSIDTIRGSMQVKMDKPCTISGHTFRFTWYVVFSQIEPVVVIGQQLLFNFMQQS